MSQHLDLKEFLAGFLVEAAENLTAARRHLVAVDQALARGQAQPKAVRELFRALHTIKGLAGMVGVDPIVQLSHRMETFLRAADRAGGRMSAPALDVLVRGVGAIEARVAALSKGREAEPASPELLDALGNLEVEGTAPAAELPSLLLDPAVTSKLTAAEKEQLSQAVQAQRRILRIDFRPSAERAAQGLSINSVRSALEAHGEVVRILPRTIPPGPDAAGGLSFLILYVTTEPDAVLLEASGLSEDEVQAVEPAEPLHPDPQTEPPPAEDESDVAAAAGGTVVRVEVRRLDDALEKLSALVVTRHRLERALADLRKRGVDVRDLSGIILENGRQLRDLRGAILRARMVYLSDVLERVPLLVRGVARATQKKVRLILDVGRAELDKSVADRIFPAIVHLVRNAIDHGLESAEERVRKQKPEEGLIRIEAHARGHSQLELRIIDDGAGIDVNALSRKLGTEIPDAPDALLDAISRPGLSTRDQATETSGRGLGMDIVRRIVVQELGGELLLSTAPNQGTTFTLRLPLSITILDAFSFVSGTQTFVTPVAGVEEIVEVDATALVAPPIPDGSTAIAGLLQRRDEAVPLLPLARMFRSGRSGAEVRKALVIRRGGESFAFGVDRMLGQQEVVVRPLEDPLVRVPGITGATDLGDGRPTLVLDLVALASTLFVAGKEGVL